MTRSLPAPGGSARVRWRWWPKEEETIRQVFASGTGLVGTSSSTAFLHCVNLCFNIYFLFVGSTFPLAPLQLHMTRLESICFPPIQFTKLEVCQKCHFNLNNLCHVMLKLIFSKSAGYISGQTFALCEVPGMSQSTTIRPMTCANDVGAWL